MKAIRVEIEEADLQKYARNHLVHRHLKISRTLREAGIPIDEGDLCFNGVQVGELRMHNEYRNGRHLRVFEWTPGDDDL